MESKRLAFDGRRESRKRWILLLKAMAVGRIASLFRVSLRGKLNPKQMHHLNTLPPLFPRANSTLKLPSRSSDPLPYPPA